MYEASLDARLLTNVNIEGGEAIDQAQGCSTWLLRLRDYKP